MKQREIKFRAWDIKGEKMYDVLNLEYMRNDEYQVVVDMTGYGNFLDLAPDEYELMQYTGLKDKRGKEIYEGDIIKIDRDSETGKLVNESNEVVQFDDGEFFVFRTSFPKDWEKYEVIGNIYENKNLLK